MQLFQWPPADAEPPAGDCSGVLTRIIFQDVEQGFIIGELTPEEPGAAPITILGLLPGIVVGESLRVRGHWETHPRFGRQLRVESYELVRPATKQALIAYLSGGLAKGIGPKRAKIIAEHFGDALLDILDNYPERLTEAPGIGPKHAAALAQAWQEHKDTHRIMLFLHKHGVGPALAARIYKQYGSQAMHILENEPYRLAREVRGVGFLTADRLAQQAGWRLDDPQRLRAALLHVLQVAFQDGHFFLSQEKLFAAAQPLVQADEQRLELALQQSVEAGEIVAEAAPTGDIGYFLPEAWKAEMELAGLLLYHIRDEAYCDTRAEPAKDPLCPRPPSPEHIRSWLDYRQAMGGLALTEAQTNAVIQAFQHPITIITGGPGTGKTAITRALADLAMALGYRLALCSPTGRAAKRLSELSGQPASTIHRLLAWDPRLGRFRYSGANLLPIDLLIVDEASMLDALLARDLLRAVPRSAHIVFIGDADQLPSVGPGHFLPDLIASGRFPVIFLTEIFRQEAGSDIITNAHLIRAGQMPRFVRGAHWRGEDCVLMERETAEEAAQAVLKVATRSLPSLGFAPEEIQVITPMYRGPAGVSALNAALQEALNPPAPERAEIRRGDTIFREGDRVLQTANDYDRNVFNGDIGRIERIDLQQQSLVVRFDLGPVVYSLAELEQLELAYALTVHKAQGSEYPAVIIVIHSSHFIMLRRNLLYTALTRAEKMAVIVGDRKGLWKAVTTLGENERLTRLALRLTGDLPAGDILPRLPLEENGDT